jgi:hypothetical protein
VSNAKPGASSVEPDTVGAWSFRRPTPPSIHHDQRG